jgi:hypothetical protein
VFLELSENPLCSLLLETFQHPFSRFANSAANATHLFTCAAIERLNNLVDETNDQQISGDDHFSGDLPNVKVIVEVENSLKNCQRLFSLSSAFTAQSMWNLAYLHRASFLFSVKIYQAMEKMSGWTISVHICVQSILCPTVTRGGR